MKLMQKCKSCGKKIAKGSVLCRSCESKKEPQLTSEQVKQITKQVKKEFHNTLKYWIGFLSVVFGLSLYQIWQKAINKMETLLVDSITKEFKQPKIRETVKDVAKTTAKKMLTDEIQPEIIKFKAEIESNVKEIDKLVNLSQFQVSNLTSKIEESDKKLKTIDEELKKALKVNEDLTELSDFMLTFIKAQSDDSEAFEQLGIWGTKESYPFREISLSMYELIRRSYLEKNISAIPVILWPEGVYTAKLSYDEFKYLFKQMPPKFHPNLVDLIWKNEKLLEEQKMELLIGCGLDIMLTFV